MHILASGPELQAVYFGHVIQAEMEKKGPDPYEECYIHDYSECNNYHEYYNYLILGV
jgi:hypothetical protein